MATSTFKLADIKDAIYSIELPDGTKRDFDVYRLSASIAKVGQTVGDTMEQYDAIRKLLGFKAESEAQASGEFTLSPRQCEVLVVDVTKTVNSLQEKKDFLSELRKSHTA